jgi:hypothetical protein
MNRSRQGDGRRSWRRILAVLFLVGCADREDARHVGGASRFLAHCESSSCGDGLSCIAGVCTRACVAGKADCTDLATAATCTDSSIEQEAVAVCDVSCSRNADCYALGKQQRCEAGFCRAGTYNGRSPSGHPLVFPCPAGDVAGDAFDYVRHRIKGDLFEIQIGYRTGSPATHEFSLCYDPDFLESSPVQTRLTLLHDANDDPGDNAHTGSTVTFDLSALAAAYQAAYQTEGGLIETNYSVYAFGALSCGERTTAAQSQMVAALEWAVDYCIMDDDCTLRSTNVSCAPSCSVAVRWPSGVEDELGEGLSSINYKICRDFAQVCPDAPTPPCAPPMQPACVNGRCQ